MCEIQTQHNRNSCHCSSRHGGYLSKKMRVEHLEKELEHMKTCTRDLEEYIQELKEE